MGLFSGRSGKLPSYAGVSLQGLLADPVWAQTIQSAGIVPASCALVCRVDAAMVASPYQRFANGMPFMSAGPAIVFIQSQSVAIAVPGERQIHLLVQPLNKGRLMLTRFRAVQIVFGRDGSEDGWTFPDMKVDTPEGKEFGDALNQFIVSG